MVKDVLSAWAKILNPKVKSKEVDWSYVKKNLLADFSFATKLDEIAQLKGNSA